MSEYFFGLGRGRLRKKVVKKINATARKHGARIVLYKDPASGWRYWFACRNYGSPFDEATASAVKDDLKEQDLWPVPTRDNW